MFILKIKTTLLVFLATFIRFLLNKISLIDVIGITLITFIFENILYYWKIKK